MKGLALEKIVPVFSSTSPVICHSQGKFDEKPLCHTQKNQSLFC